MQPQMWATNKLKNKRTMSNLFDWTAVITGAISASINGAFLLVTTRLLSRTLDRIEDTPKLKNIATKKQKRKGKGQ